MAAVGAGFFDPAQAFGEGQQATYNAFANAIVGKRQLQDQALTLDADILAKQNDISAQKLLKQNGIPRTSDGQVDFRTLAGMIAPADPKTAIGYFKEADAQDRQRETDRKDKMNEQIKTTQAMSQDLAAVTDQSGLDAFNAKAKALNYPIPPNFPTVYNEQTAPVIQKMGQVFAGQLKDMDTQLKKEQINTQKAEQIRDIADARYKVAETNIDRDKDARLRAGLPENPEKPVKLQPFAGSDGKRYNYNPEDGTYKDSKGNDAPDDIEMKRIGAGKSGGSNMAARSALVMGAANNTMNRLNELTAKEGEAPKASNAFGVHSDSVGGNMAMSAYRRLGLSSEQRRVDSDYAAIIDEAIPVFTGGLRGSDSYRKYIISQVPNQGDDDESAKEKLRVFRANIEGTSDTFQKAFMGNSAFWGKGEKPGDQVSKPGVVKDPSKMSDAEIKAALGIK